MATKESDTDMMMAAVRAEPERVWSLDELLDLRGGGRTALYQELSKLTKLGTLDRTGPGLYRLGRGVPEGKAAPPKDSAAPKAKPERRSKREKAPPAVTRSTAATDTAPAAPPPAPPVILNRVEALPAGDGRRARLRILHVEIEGDLSDATMRAALDELRRAVG